MILIVIGRKQIINDNNILIILGGLDGVYKTMRKHTSNSELQWAASCAPAESDDNKTTIATRGGIDDVLEAKRKHAFKMNFQHGACATLPVLASNPNNGVQIAAISGIDDMLDTMQQLTV